MRASGPIPSALVSVWLLVDSRLEVFEDFIRRSICLFEYLREEGFASLTDSLIVDNKLNEVGIRSHLIMTLLVRLTTVL